ncbi:hypothetical protein FE840_010945 [Peteryoungia desertarenae]|uniref:Uncharacterized protein n=1 Tax=Peteryoungia desertarenae TaxID=1813451 RepID=A0ABX6QNZ7_9HYPH|nr:hypothetical protein [Peteryoungia desertarenae]QLF70012.1 hypothetical protein FE840_010945 [Peteryoungia desertarenae]
MSGDPGTWGKAVTVVSVRTAIAAYFLMTLLLLIGVISRPDGSFVLVVTSPSGDAAENMAVISEAGGAFVWAGRYPWISVAQSDEPGFATRLSKAGAYLVLNHSLAVGCLEG